MKRHRIACILGMTGLMATYAAAGTAPAGKGPPPPPPPPAPTPFVTGTLSLLAETHFVSYGQDVWAAGNKWDDVLFHPSLELNFNLGGGWAAILGTWWDVNDNAESDIGGNVQEVDVWTGVSYTLDKWKFTLLYQEWMYASQSERIVDFKIGYTNFLNPTLTIHGRVDDDISFDTGAAFVLGVSPGTTLGPVTLSFPVQVAFDTEGFHGGDGGFSFVSAGVSATIPIVEHVALSIAATYYHTNDSVIPVNPDDDFILGSAGVVITF